MRLSVDVGGTFTDLTLVDDQGTQLFVDKVPSTPGSGDGVMAGITRISAAAGVAPTDIEIVVHGFTIATNAWLTRQGAHVVALVTEGFKDLFALGSQRRPSTYDLTARKPEPLVPRSQVVEVPERVDAFGNIVRALEPEALDALVDEVVAKGPESIAISLLFSWANAQHEQELASALSARLPNVPIYLSCAVNPQIQEYPRANTTAAAAYVGPPVKAYTNALEADLKTAGVTAPLRYMRSDGGAATGRAARDNPANMLLSGPAGGVVAALAHAEPLRAPNLITFDMGGTSADFSVIRDAEVARVRDRDFDGLPLRVPMIEIKAISAGGGSIGWVDRAGALRIGPESAGAVPGPACYDRGGEKATLTDAALQLGFIDAHHFAGGQIALNVELAAQAIRTHVASPLGLGVNDAALGMLEVATANMGQAIRELSTERGDDVGEFALLSFGGAGGLFAPFLLRELGLGEVIVPRHPGVFAAFGLQFADLRHQLQVAYTKPLDSLSPSDLKANLLELQQALDSSLEKDGVPVGDRHFSFTADMRYIGQHHELEVELPAPDESAANLQARIGRSFHALHERRYGYSHEDSPVEFTSLHGVGVGNMPNPVIRALEPSRSTDGVLTHRQVPLGLQAEWVEAPVFHRDSLRAEQKIFGPAIIVQEDSTGLVLEGQEARVDDIGFIRITESSHSTEPH